jgi:hypothetical protein
MPMRKSSGGAVLTVFIVLMVAILTVVSIGCSAQSPSGGTSGETPLEKSLRESQEASRAAQEAAQRLAQIKPDAVKQVTSTMHSVSEEYNRFIEGDVTNNTGGTITYGEVRFTLFDSSDRQVGTAYDNCSDLTPGTTWHFKALIFEDATTQFRFADLIGWD